MLIVVYICYVWVVYYQQVVVGFGVDQLFCFLFECNGGFGDEVVGESVVVFGFQLFYMCFYQWIVGWWEWQFVDDYVLQCIVWYIDVFLEVC